MTIGWCKPSTIRGSSQRRRSKMAQDAPVPLKNASTIAFQDWSSAKLEVFLLRLDKLKCHILIFLA